MSCLAPITAKVKPVPTIAEARTVPERIAALAYAADQLDAEIRDLKNEVDGMNEYEDVDLFGHLKTAQDLCLNVYRLLDAAEAIAKKVA